MNMKKLSFLVLCLVITGCSSVQKKSEHESDLAAINDVIEKFKSSIINKDKETYMKLFFSDKPEDITWQLVMGNSMHERFKKVNPNIKKALILPDNNFISLIDGAISTEKTEEETFSNLIIDTDGNVASVTFDYSFLIDGEVKNWGKEMWHMVKTKDGWKIISVIYSANDPVSPAG